MKGVFSMTTSIQKWGNSQGVRIPKILLDTLNWTEGQQIEIILKEDEIVLKSAKEKKNQFRNFLKVIMMNIRVMR